MIIRRIYMTAIFFLAFILLPSCIQETKQPTQYIRIGNGAEPKDLDPHHTTGMPEQHIVQNLFEPLISKHPRTLEPVPGMATHFDISKDRKKYTFFLREGRWSNGEPLTAADFVYAIRRLLRPETASEYAYQGYIIKNGKEFHLGKIKDPAKLGVRAVSPLILEFTLNAPVPYFINLLYHCSFYPLHQKSIEKFAHQWTRPENMVSNGAFRLQKWQMNQVVSLVPNPQYWDRETVKLEQVDFLPITNIDTQEKMFRRGAIEITNELPLEKIPSWREDKSGVFHTHSYLGNYFYWFNVRKAPLNNPLVRQALNLAIDREKIVKFVTRGNQLPATMFVPPGTGGYSPVSYFPADLSQLEKAKALLSKAGYNEKNKLPKLEMLFNTHEGHKKIAEAMQEMWKKNLGVEVELVNQEWKVFLDSMQNTHQFQLGHMGWIADYNDPTTFLDLFRSGTGNNIGGYSNPKFDKWMDAAAKQSTPQDRNRYFAMAEKVLLEDAPIIPIYIFNRNYLKKNSVRGWEDNIEDIHPLKYVSIEQTAAIHGLESPAPTEKAAH